MQTHISSNPNRNAAGIEYLGSQNWPMRLKLEIHPDGPPEIWLIEVCESDHSVPIAEWNRQYLCCYSAKWYGVLVERGPDKLTEAVQAEIGDSAEIAALIKEVRAGYEVRWDGSNNRGFLTDEASYALDILRDKIDAWTPSDDFAAEFRTSEQAYDDLLQALRDCPQDVERQQTWGEWATTIWEANDHLVDVSWEDRNDPIEIDDASI